MRFVLPEATAPSGGHNYNASVIENWPGESPEVIVVAGPWPEGDDTSRAALAEALRAPRVLVDGLVGAAHPHLIEQAVAEGSWVGLLIHMPLSEGGGLSPADQQRLTALEHRSARAASRVFATSHTAAADIRQRYGCNVVAVPPGADLGPISEPGHPPHLVTIGAVGPRKNQMALAQALQECGDLAWRATVVGPIVDAEYAAQLDAALPSRATRLAALEPAEISGLLASADLLVHPATSETWGMVVTEALAHGVPALVSAGTGAVEALSSGTTDGADLPGAVVEPGQWGAALREFLTDEVLRLRWHEAAVAARDNARGWEQVAAELAAAVGSTDGPSPDDRIMADWLALRREADRAARKRSLHLVESCAHHLGGAGTVIDVGSGTGANHDYLAPHLPGARWILLDHDGDLLEHVEAEDVERVVGGIDRLRHLVISAEPPVLVTCSALLDLLSADDLDMVAHVLADTGAVGFFALSVDGQVHFDPPLPDDAFVTNAFNAHQRRRGRPGPDAAHHLAERARQLGLTVESVATPWELADSPLTRRLITERAQAALDERPDHAERIDAWLQQRLQRTDEVVIGHVDLLLRAPEPS